jgi:tRNA A37 N6-isopentenylltransferase MiaA
MAEIQRSTRRYAKRQLIWFRATPGIEWREAGAALLERAAKFWNA